MHSLMLNNARKCCIRRLRSHYENAFLPCSPGMDMFPAWLPAQNKAWVYSQHTPNDNISIPTLLESLPL